VLLPSPHADFQNHYHRLMRDAGGVIPTRASIRPHDLKPVLPWVVMAERHGHGHLKPTLIGSAVDEVLQASFTGVNLFDYLDGDVASRLDTFYSNITDQPCGGIMERMLASENGLMRSYTSSLYPLVGSSGRMDRLVGVVSIAKTEPMLSGFGKPKDIQTIGVVSETYFDLGFGVPEAV